MELLNYNSKKPMEEMLKENCQPFDKYVEQLPIAVFETSRQGSITFINDAGCLMLGYTRDELVGLPFFQFVAPEDRNRCIATAQMS